jgi:membrane-associated phospholipid phosphatase
MVSARRRTRIDQVIEERRQALWGVVAGLLAFALLFLVLAKTTQLLPGPEDLNTGLSRSRLSSGNLWLLDRVISLGSARVAVITVAGLGVAAAVRWGLRFSVLVLVSACIVLLTTVAKALPPDTSLPSGHAAYATAVFGLGAWLCLREGRYKAATAVSAPVVLMGPARVLEGAHHTIDVLVGIALGLAWMLAIILIGGPWARGETRAPVAA